MPVLKPLEGEPLTFWHCAGDIIWRGDGRPTAITRDMAEGLRDLNGEETDAAWIAGDRPNAHHAAKLWLQLTAAVDAHDEWKRLFNPQAQKADALSGLHTLNKRKDA